MDDILYFDQLTAELERGGPFIQCVGRSVGTTVYWYRAAMGPTVTVSTLTRSMNRRVDLLESTLRSA